MGSNDYPIVLGFTENGQRITLVDCASADISMRSPGYMTEVIQGTVAIIGAHFQTAEAITTRSTWADFTHLAEWLGRDGFSRNLPHGGPLAIGFAPPDFTPVSIGRATIRLGTGWSVTGDSVREQGIKAQYSIQVDVEGPLESVIAEWMRPLQNLLTLAVDLPNTFTRVLFKSTSGETNREDELIEAIFATDVPAPPRRAPTTHDMLFAYPDIAADFQKLLSGWYRVQSDLVHVCNLYFSTRQQPGFLEERFLALVRAVEVYDRLVHGNAVRPRAEHRAIVRGIVGSTASEHQAWLREKLAFSNEPTLRTRLTRLLAIVSEVMAPIVGDLDKFAALVADTRNYYTHYDSALRGKAATSRDLFRTCQRLSTLIAALLLARTGTDPAVLVGLFSKNQSWLYLRRIESGLEE